MKASTCGRLAMDALATIPVYFAGLALWMLAQFVNIAHPLRTASPIADDLIPPVLLAVVFLAWRIAALVSPEHDRDRRRRRILELVALGFIGAAFAGVHMIHPGIVGHRGGESNSLGTLVAFGLMNSVTLIAAFRDRNAETPLLLACLAMVFVVPLVIIAQTLATIVADAIYKVFHSVLSYVSLVV